MKWFIVVVMMSHTNLSGVEETPLFIGFKEFDDRQSCMSHAFKNQHTYFAKAISEYGNKLPPKLLNCVDGETLKKIAKESEVLLNEKGV